MHRKVGSTEGANVQGVSIVSHALKRLIQVIRLRTFFAHVNKKPTKRVFLP